MRRLRWAMDGGGFWELDLETPATMEGTARPVAAPPRAGRGEGNGCRRPLLVPLGLSRGARLSRAKQLDFMRRFMASPLVPSFSGPRHGGPGLVLHHADVFHLRDYWSAALMEQFLVQKFVSCVKKKLSEESQSSISAGGGRAFSWIRTVASSAIEAYRLGFGTEMLVTPDSSVVLELYGDGKDAKGHRSKVVFNHKFLQHNLTLEAASPGLFVDNYGTYWDVPLSMAVDFSSVSPDSGPRYHLCLQHNSGQPKNFCTGQTSEVPLALLPGFCAKAAFSIKRNVDIWRKKDGKVKMVQPYDVFRSDPHISASGTIGSVLSTFLGDNAKSLREEDALQRFRALSLHIPRGKFSAYADSFASASLTMQHGNFQRLFLDLTRLHARVDFTSGSALLSASASLAKDLLDSRKPGLDAIRAVFPDVTLALQQQVIGPISFRVESRLAIDLEHGRPSACLEEPIFALEYAMQVLSSARATAWFCPKRQEAMVELRFFES